MPTLCFLRHGEALSQREGNFLHDSERPLTELGCNQILRATHGIRALDLSLKSIYCSPYLRARQTADIVAEALGLVTDLHVTEWLCSGTHWSAVRRGLENDETDSILLVGHEPDMSIMTGQVIGSESGGLHFGTGTLSIVTVDAMPPRGPGVLAGFYSVKDLATMAS
jgi:phosphohistidine phosphatase